MYPQNSSRPTRASSLSEKITSTVRGVSIERDIFEARTGFELRTMLMRDLLEPRETQRFLTVLLGFQRALEASIMMALSRLFDDKKDAEAGNLRVFLKYVKNLHPRSGGEKRTAKQIEFLNSVDSYISRVSEMWSELEAPRHTFYAHTNLGTTRRRQDHVKALDMINLAEEIHDRYYEAFEAGVRPHQDSSLQHDMRELVECIQRGIPTRVTWG